MSFFPQDDLAPLVVRSRLASRAAPGAENGPLPYLFFSGLLSPMAVAELRHRAGYLLDAGSEHYAESRRAIGATYETVYLIHGLRGDVALVVLEAPGAEAVFDALGGSRLPFHAWLERRTLQLFELESGDPGPAGHGERSEIIFASATVRNSAF
jgi:hypothetical protein